jgi:hypothetical protein
MVYNEIFQPLIVEGDVLISKPLLDLAFDTVKRCKSPTSKQFLQIPNNKEIQRGQARNVWWMGKMLPCQVSAEW